MGLPNIITKINSLETKHTALETKHNTLETNHNTLNSSVVKLTGNQTIGGTKTFTSIPYVKGSGPALILQNTSCVKGTVPTANNTFLINCFENAGTAAKNRIGLIQAYYNTSGAVGVGLWAYKPVAGNTTSASLQVIYPASGNPYATCPTPDASANGTHIATTAWVRGKGVLVESGKSGTIWYRKYSDGFIEQGGTVSISEWQIPTITLLKAFSNTNYTICVSGISYNGAYHAIGCLQSKTTTSFKHYFYNNQSINPSWYACGY